MFVDVLKRYLLIVWNFFFGQISTESIKDSPSSSEDQPTILNDVNPPVDVDSNDINIENRDDEDDDIEEIFDDNEDEEEEELELGDEDEKDEEAVIVPKKSESKVVTNDTPTEPSVPANKIEEVKVSDVLPKPKDEIKKPEPPKVPEETTSEKNKLKNDIDNVKKSEIPVKVKPELEVGEREGNPLIKPVVSEKDASKFKSSEFEIVEREDRDVPPSNPKAEFEIVERGTAEKPVLPPPPPPSSSLTIKSDQATVPDPAKDNTSRPEVKVDSDDKKPLKPVAPEKPAAHVKFQDDVNENSGKGHVSAVDFATLEKSEMVVKPPGVTTGNATAGDVVGDFLSAEQAHGGQLLHRHHESIQDQQLDYSDSGEEISDDDIEIDYEDDEDDEEVVEVKPLPPVARSVYKKND